MSTVYYLTCFISGLIEIGTVFWAIKCGYSLVGIIGLALAYQSGNLLRFFVGKRLASLQSAFFAANLGISCILLANLPPGIEFVLKIVLLSTFSTMLQNVRSSTKGIIPRWMKRTCRVVGFICSFMMYFFGTYCMIALCACLLIISTKTEKYNYEGWIGKVLDGQLGHKVCWAMVTHQAHYFAYNYVMLALVMYHFKNPVIASLCFAANWVPYTITEPLIQKTRIRNWYGLAIGAHLFNAVVLTLMYFTVHEKMLIAVILWVLTGFGGGNVFTIRKALAVRITYDSDVWNFSEQIGHLLGGIVSLLICMFCTDPSAAMLAGAAFALITIIVISETLRRME